jgi:hypothetical protein
LEIFFGLFRENSVCFGCFYTGPKHRNKPKKKFFGFAKQTEKQPKQIEFRFILVPSEKKFDCFEDTLVADPKLSALDLDPTYYQRWRRRFFHIFMLASAKPKKDHKSAKKKKKKERDKK